MFVTRDKVEARVQEEIAAGRFVVATGECDDCGTSDVTYGPGQEVVDFMPPEIVDAAAIVCYQCVIFRAGYTLGMQSGVDTIRASLAWRAQSN